MDFDDSKTEEKQAAFQDKLNPVSLANAPEAAKKSRTFIMCALQKNGLDYLSLTEDQKMDLTFIKIALVYTKIFNANNFAQLRDSLPEPYRNSQRIELFVKNIPSSLPNFFEVEGLACFKYKYLPLYLVGRCEFFKHDREIVLTAVEQEGEALQDVCKEFRNDREIVLVAVGNNRRAIMCASEGLQKELGSPDGYAFQNSMTCYQQFWQNISSLEFRERFHKPGTSGV
jgi:hypothetical protein